MDTGIILQARAFDGNLQPVGQGTWTTNYKHTRDGRKRAITWGMKRLKSFFPEAFEWEVSIVSKPTTHEPGSVEGLISRRGSFTTITNPEGSY